MREEHMVGTKDNLTRMWVTLIAIAVVVGVVLVLLRG
jgi:hypothetical protein